MVTNNDGGGGVASFPLLWGPHHKARAGNLHLHQARDMLSLLLPLRLK